MRVPLSWLAEYVELPTGVTLKQVHEDLVRVGFEEEELIPAEVSGPLVVGQVLEFVDEPQSNNKTIRWVQVRVAPESAEDQAGAVRGIVCGAHNFDAGDKVVVALPGAVLPGDFAISARKTYGHVSDGMLASAKELGLGDDHSGIIVLSRFGLDPEIGSDAAALLGLDDSAVDINVTTDRGYALSIRGIAREYSHSTGAEFRDPAKAIQPVRASGFEVSVDDKARIRDRVGCQIFVTRVVRGINAEAPTPPWMVSRLKLAGIRSISLPVDITNYVQVELGQPLHGYDLAKLAGGIVVRRATEGETLTTLDGVERKLHPEDLLITDDSGAIGLAGVMGGASTEITDTTSDVLIEAANFDPVSIARTARRHKLPSEASRRFERGVDPKVAEIAAERAVQLLVELAGGTVDELGSFLDESTAPKPIILPRGFASALVGVNYTDAQVGASLTLIGAQVVADEDSYVVTPPSWRPDLTMKYDLVEEIARITGYDQIPLLLPVAPPGRGLTPAQQLRRRASNMLAAAGFTETISFPFLAPGVNQTFRAAEESVAEVKLSNALDGSAPFLRRSMIPGMLQTAHRNVSRGLGDIAIFEQGLVFLPEEGHSYGHEVLPAGGMTLDEEVLTEINDSLVPQPRHIAAVMLGNALTRQPEQYTRPFDWQDAVETVALIAQSAGLSLEVRQGSHAAFHPGRTAEVYFAGAEGETVLGYAGELLPSLAESYHLPRTVAALELDLDALARLAPKQAEAQDLATKPAATQDLSLLLAADHPAGEVIAALREGAGELLEDVRLVDDYRGEGIAEGMKSLTFALRFRAEDRTLTAAEATEVKMAGVALATERFGATLRD